MINKIFTFIITIILLNSCINERGDDNIVIQHISIWPDGLHPFNNNSAVRTFIFQYTQKTLIKLDHETLEYIPTLVESMPLVSEDGLEYTYIIKDGTTWDDGSKLTAKDVEFSVKTMICPLTNNTQIRSNYSTVIKSIILDENNPLKFTMQAQQIHVDNQYIFSELYLQQQSFWDPNKILDNVSFANLFDEKFDEKYATEEISEYFTKYNSDDNSFIPNKLVGLGSYQVSTMETDEYIILDKKENWWGENSKSIYNQNYPDKIIFKIIKEDAAVYLSLKSNKIDVSNRIGTKSYKIKRARIF